MFKLKNLLKILNWSLFGSLLFILLSYNYVLALQNSHHNPDPALNELEQRIDELLIERNRIATRILNHSYYRNPELITILESRYQNLTQIIINLQQQIIILRQTENYQPLVNHYQNHNGNHSHDDHHDNHWL